PRTDRFASPGETFFPKLTQSQLPPQLTSQPTASKYARPSQFQFPEPHLNPIAHTCGNGVVVRKQAHRGVLLPVFVEYRQALSPCFFLLVVDLSQIQHRSLCRATRREPTIFHNAEIPMDLPVLLALRASQKHPLAQCQNLSG